MTIEKSSTVTPREKPARKTKQLSFPQQPSHPLPFVKLSGEADERNHFWTVNPTGDYVADCEVGKAYARQAMAYMSARDLTPLLGWIARDMPREFSGLEIGFFSVIAHYVTFKTSALGVAA